MLSFETLTICKTHSTECTSCWTFTSNIQHWNAYYVAIVLVSVTRDFACTQQRFKTRDFKNKFLGKINFEEKIEIGFCLFPTNHAKQTANVTYHRFRILKKEKINVLRNLLISYFFKYLSKSTIIKLLWQKILEWTSLNLSLIIYTNMLIISIKEVGFSVFRNIPFLKQNWYYYKNY